MRRIVLVLLLIAGIVAAASVVFKGRGLSAVTRQPLPGETRMARAAWQFMVPEAARDAVNPVPPDPEVLKDARAHFADHCATCHANDGSGDTPIGRRVFPRARDLRSESTQHLTDGELFYAIEQGIPWTAMPGWATSTAEGERQSWALVRFIRHLPMITSDELREMDALNPKPPPDEKREQEIEDFLNGPKPAPSRGGRGG